MDLQFLWMLLKIIIFLPFILLLIYISLKFGGNKLQSMQNGKYIKILERTNVSKTNSLLVVRLGEKIYVMSSTNNEIKIVSELNEEEVLRLEDEKLIPQYSSLEDFLNKTGMKSFLKGKLTILKKEDKNE
ncbi:flagellar biosynthetic protein FliO [Clostridium fermenticellae]|uniref:Flagellar protein n=1 Tax=Clostridium fermenticellae TaxID=2068654 RepID=A0A386H581_9CLOT|nr:flagellar biosynthetic protein FliO [Clostridium fermenticellae]AYD40675.1 flagellar biosynthetic protein FliO [Clostridium fermenticellae]